MLRRHRGGPIGALRRFRAGPARLVLSCLAAMGCSIGIARSLQPVRATFGRAAVVAAASDASGPADDATPSVNEGRAPQNSLRRAVPIGPGIPDDSSIGALRDADRGAARDRDVLRPRSFVPPPPFHPPRLS